MRLELNVDFGRSRVPLLLKRFDRLASKVVGFYRMKSNDERDEDVGRVLRSEEFVEGFEFGSANRPLGLILDIGITG